MVQGTQLNMAHMALSMSTNKVIHIELVQVIAVKLLSSIFTSVLIIIRSNEVTSSNAVEYQRLIRALDFLEQNSIVVETLITERYKQIAKYMRQAHPDITHQFDVWLQKVNPSLLIIVFE